MRLSQIMRGLRRYGSKSRATRRRKKTEHARRLGYEALESRQLLAVNVLDINGDDVVSAADALMIANTLNNAQSESLPAAGNEALDVNTDGMISAADFALFVDYFEQNGANEELDQILGAGDPVDPPDDPPIDPPEDPPSTCNELPPMATLSITDASEPEAPGTLVADTSHMEFTVTLTGDVPGGFTVDYSTLDITAQSIYDVNTLAPKDFDPESAATLTFAGTDGETQTIDITVRNDLWVELDETFELYLHDIAYTNPPADVCLNVTIDESASDMEATGTIEDNDSAKISIVQNSPEVEGTSGSYTKRFFHLDSTNPIDVPVQVNILTTDGTATQSDHDYAPPPSSVTYDNPNGGLRSFEFDVFRDFKIERDETFDIAITGLVAQGRDVTIDIAQAMTTVTIVNDDHGIINLVARDKVTLQHVSFDALENDWTNIEFAAQLYNVNYPNGAFAKADVDIEVNWQTIDGSAQDVGTGPGSNDYNGGSGLVQVFADDIPEGLPVSVNPDNIVERSETFDVKIVSIDSFGRSISFGVSPLTPTIRNDDASVVTLSGTLDSIPEKDNPNFTDVVLNVGLSLPVRDSIQIAFTNTDGSASSAFTSQDYLMLTASPLIIPAGSNHGSITVRVFGDTKNETNEDFTIELTSVTAPAGLSVTLDPLNDDWTGTIQDDD